MNKLSGLILKALAEATSPLTSAEIGEKTGATMEIASLALNKLFKQKLVKRKRDESVVRVRYLYVCKDKTVPGFALRSGMLEGTKRRKDEQPTAVKPSPVATAKIDSLTICLADRDIVLSLTDAQAVHRVLDRVLKDVAVPAV